MSFHIQTDKETSQKSMTIRANNSLLGSGGVDGVIHRAAEMMASWSFWQMPIAIPCSVQLTTALRHLHSLQSQRVFTAIRSIRQQQSL